MLLQCIVSGLRGKIWPVHKNTLPKKPTHTYSTHTDLLLRTYAVHEACCENDFLSADYPHTARSLFHFTDLILYVIEFIPNKNALKLPPISKFHPMVFRDSLFFFIAVVLWTKLHLFLPLNWQYQGNAQSCVGWVGWHLTPFHRGSWFFFSQHQFESLLLRFEVRHFMCSLCCQKKLTPQSVLQ